MSDELKPCPFCGGKAEWDAAWGAIVCHADQEVRGPSGTLIGHARTGCGAKADSVAKWNRRVEPRTRWRTDEPKPEDYPILIQSGLSFFRCNCRMEWMEWTAKFPWIPFPEPAEHADPAIDWIKANPIPQPGVDAFFDWCRKFWQAAKEAKK